MTTAELVLPHDYPAELLCQRAIDHLETQTDQAVMAKTGRPIRMAGLLIGLVVVAGYLDVVAGGFLSGTSRELYTLVQLSMMTGIVACLGKALVIGRRMQNEHDMRVQDIRDRKLCALAVLNARLEDLQKGAALVAAIEPKAIVSEDLAQSARALAAERALQANFEKASFAAKDPTLHETVITSPKAEPRRITLN